MYQLFVKYHSRSQDLHCEVHSTVDSNADDLFKPSFYSSICYAQTPYINHLAPF